MLRQILAEGRVPDVALKRGENPFHHGGKFAGFLDALARAGLPPESANDAGRDGLLQENGGRLPDGRCAAPVLHDYTEGEFVDRFGAAGNRTAPCSRICYAGHNLRSGRFCRGRGCSSLSRTSTARTWTELNS